jgi:V8-like Glu-specific endopeptidase
MKKIFFLTLLVCFRFVAFADEGMWIPLFLGYNEAEMQQMGFRLTADDVYSVNHHSMKDGIVLFGGGCTGELISPDGLLITNHHCGYSFVQRHSSVEHNYLHNGFWSKSREEELVTSGLTVTFLVRMEDVTSAALKDVTASMTESERTKQVEKNIKEITKAATDGTHYTAIVKPFFYGNQYFLFVNEVFRDVRLVGVPPESIGKFGGDTDNWMWPRHTGDFSLWRIYTDKDGNPADYSPENIPLKSKKYFPISIKGVNENDFTLVFGYPGTTQQFLISDAVDVVVNVQNPVAIHSRDLRLAAMKRQMEKSTAIRLMYSAKANSISNGWKKWQGESKGINECHVIEKKQAEEAEFQKWVEADANRKAEYGQLLSDMRKVYGNYRDKVKVNTYLSETFIGVEMVKFLYSNVLKVINTAASSTVTDAQFDEARNKLVAQAESYFASYNSDIDAECFVELMHYYFTTQDSKLIPTELQHYTTYTKADWQAMFDRAKNKAPYFANGDKFVNFAKNAKRKEWTKLKDHELYKLILPAFNQYFANYDQMSDLRAKLDLYYRTYVKALMEKDKDRTFYPDANLTMRVTYGKVRGFAPADGVEYVHYTTLDGVIAKDNPDIFDYKVDPKLKELYKNKDYGRYANEKGQLPVCFIASNHTTGGNSGSPVINADGELIGVNFDRVWEGTMSDINYDVNRCRNISLDARYFLFIIDKFANAQNIINELDIRTK